MSIGDVVVEVGPGDGALTRRIVEVAESLGNSVVLVELDVKYASRMEAEFGHLPDVRVIYADARDVDFDDLPEVRRGQRYKVIANLPYYAGTPIVRSFLERDRRPASMTVMLQREVARDMCASPGKMSLLSLAVQMFATPKSLFRSHRAHFDLRLRCIRR